MSKTKAIPISVQLYSVRDHVHNDFPAVLRRIADIGYVGVEFAGLHGMKPAAVRRVLDDLGLVASSCHGGIPDRGNVAEIIDTAKTLGLTRHISGFGPDQFATEASTLAAAAQAREGAELLKGSGISFGIHNHWWEFDKKFGQRYPHEVFMAAAPDVFAEVDTYWVTVGGADAAKAVRELGRRAPLLHIKDGPGNREQAMTAVGHGSLDWAKILAGAGAATEWLVVELDRCDTDMFQAVADSYTYLVSRGFARGRK